MKSITRLLLDETGAVFVETLVALPVLGVVLAGILALNAMYSAKLEAKARARRVAWLQADSGQCAVRACVGRGCQAIEEEIKAGGLDDLSSARDGRFSLSSFVGSVKEFFIGRSTTGLGTAEARTPPLVSPGETRKRGATTLLCNTTARRTASGGSIVDHACSTGLSKTEYAGEVCR